MRTPADQNKDMPHSSATDEALRDPTFQEEIADPSRGTYAALVQQAQAVIMQNLRQILRPQENKRQKRTERSLRGMEYLSPRVAMDASGAFTEDVTGMDAAEWGEVASGTPAGALESIVPHPTSVMNDLALSVDGKTMATSARDGKIHLYDAQSGTLQKILTGHTGNVVQVDFSPDGKKLASVSYDRSVRIWEIPSGNMISKIDLPQIGARVKFSPDGNRLAIGLAEMATQVVDLRTGAIENIEYPRSTEAARFDFTADSSGLAHSSNNTIALYDLNAHQYIRTYEGLSDQIYSVDIDPSGKYLAGGDNSGKSAIWDVHTGQRVALMQDHTGKPTAPGGIWAIQFDARSAHLISADYSGRVIVRDVSGLDAGDVPVEIARYQGPRQPGSIVATPAGQVFAMNTAYDQASGKVIIYDLPDPPTTCEPAPATTQDAENSALALELADILSQPEEKEAPIKPDLSVVKIEGLNIVASVSSPHNKSVVSVGPRGVLSRQNLSHEGGTAFELAYVTFDRNLMSGDYVLFLTDAESGKTLDGIGVRWNMRSGVLSLIDPGNDLIKADTAVDTSAFDSLMNINSAYLGDEQINWIMSARLYQLTNDLPPGYDFDISGAELEEKIYAVRPEYHPDNRYEEIMRRWREQYPTFQSGDVERWYDWERIEFFNRMKEGLAYYEKAMTEMMQIAVDGFIQIRKGMNENQMEYNLNLAFDRWINPINKIYKDQARKLAELQNIGITLPSRNRIIESGRLVLDKAWQEIIQRAGDVEGYRQYQENMREQGLLQDALGQWMAISESDGTEVPPEMDRKQIALAAKIRRVLETSGDPRITALNMHGKNQLVLLTASLIPLESTADEIVKTFLVAISDTDSTSMIGGYNVESENMWQRLKTDVQEMDRGSVFQEMKGLYQNNDPYISISIGGISVKSTTVASRIALGLYQNAVALRGDKEALITLCLKIEQVTGIEANRLYGLINYYHHESFARRLVYLFEASGYPIAQGSVTEVSEDAGLRPTLEYKESFIRIHIDVPSTGSSLLHIQANLVNIVNGITIIENVVPISPGTLYIDVPAHILKGRSMEVGFKVIGWLENAGERLSGKTVGVDASLLNTESTSSNTGNFNIDASTMTDMKGALLDEAKQEFVHSILDFNDVSFPENSANQDIINYLINIYISDTSADRLKFDSYNELEGILHGAGIECKPWVKKVINAATEGEVNIPPTTADNTAWHLTEESSIEEMAPINIRGSKSFSEVIRVYALPGDTVQMTGSIDSFVLHTMIIGKITDEGVWVFDSNWSTESNDNTVRYHYLKFIDFDAKVANYSIYRATL